jgi:hypothetical protein
MVLKFPEAPNGAYEGLGVGLGGVLGGSPEAPKTHFNCFFETYNAPVMSLHSFIELL